MNPDPEAFFEAIDKMILAGISNSRVSFHFRITESSVRKRKRLLRERGMLPMNPSFQAKTPDKPHASER